MKVTVIIPTYNRCESVKRILDALSAQTFPSQDYEVIVSIDGSEDGTLKMVNKFDSPYKLQSIWEPNSGRAFACNRGVRASRGEILIILDDDMYPSPKLVEAHYLAHQRCIKCGVIGAAPITINESSTAISCYMAMRFNTHLKRISEPGYKIRIWDFYSGNFSIRKEVLLEAGAFSESFKIYGYEDVEFAYRLMKTGGEIVYDPDALCTQYYTENLRSLSRKIIESGKTAVLLVNLHPETFEELQFREYNLTGWKWRTLRLCLIWTSILIPMTTDAIIYSINLFEKSNPKIHEKLYYLAMDYFFWLGVWTAIRKDKSNKQLISKIKSYKKAQTCPTP